LPLKKIYIYIKKQMKVFFVICLCMISFSLSVEEIDCEETKAPNPSGAKDCNARKTSNTDRVCCYIKGKMRNKYVIQEVDGCMEVKKEKIENDQITQFLETYKSYGSKFSLDCFSSYIKTSLLLILILLI